MVSEKRLIDANALKELVYRKSDNLRNKWTSPAVILAVDAQPTVDAVEVVRCKDCKHREKPAWLDGYRCGNPDYGMASGVESKDDDFCSYGER